MRMRMRTWTVLAVAAALATPAVANAAVAPGESPAARADDGNGVVLIAKKKGKKKKGRKKTKRSKRSSALTFRVGPSWELNDYVNQFKVGAGFEKRLQSPFALYIPVDFGFYNNVVTITAVPGVKIRPPRGSGPDGPFDVYGLAGAGVLYANPSFGSSDAGLALRVGGGAEVNLAKAVEAPVSAGLELTYTIAPVGLGGTPMLIDALLVIGYGLPF